jgi:hypothetical protein
MIAAVQANVRSIALPVTTTPRVGPSDRVTLCGLPRRLDPEGRAGRQRTEGPGRPSPTQPERFATAGYFAASSAVSFSITWNASAT